MARKLTVEREEAVPFVWGWDDESVFFVFDPLDQNEKPKRLQDHPELWSRVLKLCVDHFTSNKSK